ncbi:hypothetical protein [Parvibaculum sp.]|jgi:benzoyl-CoA reductase/2-hydroxyglutaryl-CoA dehydratase subunit BcrC/BadD/HgdB|uniref:hypothetical protein n=1 Tax=Parvibaculum sp. TaxID=2024848 RepID=UPI000C5C862E|nr:hypothetical protein [Parvibaculum sp.]MAM95515.1 hypothetical protein [Parvibaculum sp.]HCX69224.1 hypothetical protein [Rhodobiaceae bacterium]|tara:strand:- start:9438 stop:9635 length:198 start_codon:yes stop_codon:yes gene_type:complete
MHTVELSHDQATHFLDLIESFRKGEITRQSLRNRLKLLEEGANEHLWELFLMRFDRTEEDAWNSY